MTCIPYIGRGLLFAFTEMQQIEIVEGDITVLDVDVIVNAANERIKRLEEAGDEMYRWITVKRLCSIDCTEAWDQAKETKP